MTRQQRHSIRPSIAIRKTYGDPVARIADHEAADLSHLHQCDNDGDEVDLHVLPCCENFVDDVDLFLLQKGEISCPQKEQPCELQDWHKE